MNRDARDAIADAILQGRYRYAGRLLHIWKAKAQNKHLRMIEEDVEHFSTEPLELSFTPDQTYVIIKYMGERFVYTQAACADETW